MMLLRLTWHVSDATVAPFGKVHGALVSLAAVYTVDIPGVKGQGRTAAVTIRGS